MHRLIFLVAILTLFLVSTVGVEGANPSPLSDPDNTGDWILRPDFSDEFLGNTLDTDKWYDHNPGWIGRQPVFFHPGCVAVVDGELVLTAYTESTSRQMATLPHGYTHIAGYVMSRNPILYGYFEMEARLMDGPLVSGFWFYNHASERWTEINLVEIPAGLDRYRGALITNLHVHHSPEVERHYSVPRRWNSNNDFGQDYHVFGLEWTADSIKWYVDGRLIRQVENVHWHQPLYININNEANPYFAAMPSDTSFPASYHVRYVRTWQRPPTSFGTLYPSNYARNIDAQQVQLEWETKLGTQYRVIVAEDPNFSRVVADTTTNEGTLKLDQLRFDETYFWKIGALNTVSTEYVWNHNGVQQFRTRAHETAPQPIQEARLDTALGGVFLRWQPTNADYYRIYRNGLEIAKLPYWENFFWDQEVTAGEAYSYLITAVNPLGEALFPQTLTTTAVNRKIVADEIFAQALPAHWRFSGAWTHDQPGAFLTTIFPRGLGNVAINLEPLRSYQLTLDFQVTRVGNPDFASIRVSAVGEGQNRHQVLYMHYSGLWNADSRSEAGQSNLGEAVLPLELEVQHQLQLTAIGDLLLVRLDNETILEALQPTYQTIQQLQMHVSNLDLKIVSIKIEK